MSEKKDLSGEQIVMGNRTEQQQLYQIFYYPPEQDGNIKRIDKTAVYFYLKNKEEGSKPFARRSIYFADVPQYRHFIINLISAYFHWLDKRVKPAMPRNDYRKMMLSGLLEEIHKKTMEGWSKENGKAKEIHH